jgi:hypothetical protein
MIRDNFAGWQKGDALKSNADWVRIRWRDDFQSATTDNYMCENDDCRFISDKRELFEVDHLVSCKEGGTANRMVLEEIIAIETEIAKPLDKQDIGILALANLNAQVLCKGCNQAKKGVGSRPDEIPLACGYAYSKREEDKNPDHVHAGPPPVSGYVKPRYRKNL